MQQVQEQVEPEILIHKRTSGTGHMELTLNLADTETFVNAELAAGRLVFLELGAESWIIRKGHEVRDFVRRLFKPGGKRPRVTTFARMAGGQEPSELDGATVEEAPPVEDLRMPPALPLRTPGMQRGYDVPAEVGPAYGTGLPPQTRRLAPTAEIKAWNALIERIGERAALGIATGGGMAVRSTLWPYVIYVVTPEIITVINQGVAVSRICIVPSDGSSVWDAVLDRIQLLQAGEEGETQVWATGAIR